MRQTDTHLRKLEGKHLLRVDSRKRSHGDLRNEMLQNE
jgi:hypothetical protein